jgi:hypothetical protein
MTPLSRYRRQKNRCNHRLIELRDTRTDSWRCNILEGHDDDHESRSGHRRWPNTGTEDDYIRDHRTHTGHIKAALIDYIAAVTDNTDSETEAIANEIIAVINEMIADNVESK